jgi:DNA (cytosine-5)-methyltransferase 1
VNILSLFSGVGGMDLGLERAGHEVVGMCEIDKHARSVLARHWPDVPIHDDVTTLETEDWNGRVDVVAGGSPCQDLSVAGKRGGLDGERSGLFWHQCRIADETGAGWVVWENVAGALSSNKGADFSAVLWGLTGAFVELPDGKRWGKSGFIVGPKRAAVWRLFDAQWFGVAQRRRRAFVVAGPRGQCGPEILFESESLCWDSAPIREAGQEVAGTLGGGTAGGGPRTDTDRMTFVPDVVGTVAAKWAKGSGGPAGDECQNMVLDTVDDGLCGTISASWSHGTGNTQVESGICIPVSTKPRGVRRLTPRECERLMGWPDDWTCYDAAGNVIADSHRYRMCGNGVVSNVTEWIGRRLP